MSIAARRFYFYYLNERGNLFHIFDTQGLLSRSSMPSGPTFLHDGKFLNFFFSRVQYCDVQLIASAFGISRSGHASNSTKAGSCYDYLHSREFLFETRFSLEGVDGSAMMTPWEMLLYFPYVSLCGPEINFMHTQDGVPAVFHDLHIATTTGEVSSSSSRSSGDTSHSSSSMLVCAGGLSEPFEPSSISVSRDGKLFHQLSCLRALSAQYKRLAHIETNNNNDNNKNKNKNKSNRAALLAKRLCAGGALRAAAGCALPQGISSVADGADNGEGMDEWPVLSSLDLSRHGEGDDDDALIRGLCETAAASTSSVTLARGPTTSIQSVAEQVPGVASRPTALLGASIGLKLGLDYVCEDTDEEGHFVMMWEGKRVVLPFL